MDYKSLVAGIAGTAILAGAIVALYCGYDNHKYKAKINAMPNFVTTVPFNHEQYLVVQGNNNTQTVFEKVGNDWVRYDRVLNTVKSQAVPRSLESKVEQK
ncbi:MAG: hypothetical protein PHD81_00310 [Candidatus Nanoarchaeia archaeon]|nr:hypothetical protein [Candidatus Nanoarchaeia archaeon]MDD5587534.1 hypothetical protein [Candidatus Nanoarchaeia archaeon]